MARHTCHNRNNRALVVGVLCIRVGFCASGVGLCMRVGFVHQGWILCTRGEFCASGWFVHEV